MVYETDAGAANDIFTLKVTGFETQLVIKLSTVRAKLYVPTWPLGIEIVNGAAELTGTKGCTKLENPI